jgi:NADH:ubiquinone oxidoreductase subunit B-like Fe-S oxidoreductase
MVVAGTITVKMAPRVKRLWDMMPEPRWCVAMGSCAISGDFYRNIYAVVPGVDTFIPVDVYVPGCPPAPDHVHAGMHVLAEKIKAVRQGTFHPRVDPAAHAAMIRPSIPRIGDPDRDPALSGAQALAAFRMDPGCNVAPRPEDEEDAR